MNYKKILKISISIVLSVVLVWFLYSQISLKDLINLFHNVSYKYLLLGLFIYLLIFFLRVIRMNLFLEGKINLKNLSIIMAIHNFFINVIPARLGELSYVYMIKKTNSIDISKNVFSLLATRILDVYGQLLLFLIFVLLLNPIPPLIKNIWILCFVFLAIFTLLIIIVLIFKERFFIILNRILRLFSFNRFMLIQKISQKSEEMVEHFKILRNKKIFYKTLILTFFINILMYSIVYFVLLAFTPPLGVIKTFVGSGIAGFTNILPIQGIMNFGTFEGGWTLGFLLLGMQKELAIITGFSYHIMSLFYTFILTICGIIFIRKS